MSRPWTTQATNRYTLSQHAGGFNSEDDSGDDLFNDYATVATLPLDGHLPNQATQGQQSQSQATYTTQPTQKLHTPVHERFKPSAVVQVPASSPMQPTRAPMVPAMGRGSLMAPAGTTFQRPITAAQLRQSQKPQVETISDDEGYRHDSSDDDHAAKSSDIKPSIIQNGRLLSTAEHTVVPESPEAKIKTFAQYAYNPAAPQKRSADVMANSYASVYRPVKQVKQSGPARAQPVEAAMTMNDVHDWSLQRKIKQMIDIYPHLTIRQCHDALAKSKGSIDDAASLIIDQENAVDLTISDDELTTKSPWKPTRPTAKRQLDAPLRTIADKWSSTQHILKPSASASQGRSQSNEEPTTPKRPPRKRLVRRSERAQPPISPSSPDPLSQYAPVFRPQNHSAAPPVSSRRKVVLVSDDESLVDSDEDSEEEEDDAGLSDRSSRLLRFINACTPGELADLSNQPSDIIELVLSKRPFNSLDEVREISLDSSTKTRTGKTRTIKRPVGENLINMAEEMWKGYEAVDDLVTRCEELGKPIAAEMKKWGFDAFGTAQHGELQLVDLESGKESGSAHDSGIGTPSSTAGDNDSDPKGSSAADGNHKIRFLQQPKMMSKDLVMKDYQVAGLNWLALLFSQKLSCILADDMGLGKTCQVIAFFAHLHEIGVTGPHVVIVPGSTLENWLREFQNFCPNLRVEPYYGLQDERAEHRVRLEQELKSINVIVTTYDMASKSEDAKFLRRQIKPVVCVYDEGHALRNSQSKRYKELMRIPATFRLLLTGTPLQNNLQELVSLLAFIMPDVFSDAQEHLQYIFKFKAKTTDKDHAALLSSQRITRARSMMTPFILRRKKHQVLKHLPKKTRRVEYCDLAPLQQTIYENHVAQVKQILANRKAGLPQDAKEKTNVLMKLRQAAIHPLLFRTIFTDEIIKEMSLVCLDEPRLADRNPDLVYEDMTVMTDWELHRFCLDYPDTMSRFALQKQEWLDSGKVTALVRLLEANRAAGARTLVFSQFTMVMNILEEVLESIAMPYFRLDGSTRMDTRQDLLDAFHADEAVPVFMLSTKAGGAGINLACANKVIIFDGSFNPQEDVQAENRAHRVGQLREVEVVRLVTRGTIEEQIHKLGESKLVLDDRVAGAAGEAVETDVTTGSAGATGKAEKEGFKMVEKMMLRSLEGVAEPGTDVDTPAVLSSDDDDKDDASIPRDSTTASDTDAASAKGQAALAHRAKDAPRDLAVDFLKGLKARGVNVAAGN